MKEWQLGVITCPPRRWANDFVYLNARTSLSAPQFSEQDAPEYLSRGLPSLDVTLDKLLMDGPTGLAVGSG